MSADFERQVKTIDDAIAELERLRGALRDIANQHLPSMPASTPCTELQWRDRHILHLRSIAEDALNGRGIK